MYEANNDTCRPVEGTPTPTTKDMLLNLAAITTENYQLALAISDYLFATGDKDTPKEDVKCITDEIMRTANVAVMINEILYDIRKRLG